jgi:hypothetical protein
MSLKEAIDRSLTRFAAQHRLTDLRWRVEEEEGNPDLAITVFKGGYTHTFRLTGMHEAWATPEDALERDLAVQLESFLRRTRPLRGRH